MTRGRTGTRAVAVAVVAAALVASAAGCAAGRQARASTGPEAGDGTPGAPPVVASQPAAASDDPAAQAPAPPITYPEVGGGAWTVAGGGGGVAGRAGTLLRFRVAVERDIRGVDAQQFADEVLTTLAAPQGWTAGGQWRLQRVGPEERANFTVYLATPATRDVLCQSGRDRYTSCRRGDNVVINVARWVHGVPNYGAGLDVYRQYLVSHEVGHRLGQGHELCPGPGRPAPVMEQQTLGLHGCTANPWPYPGGQRYTGPSGEYGDHLPR